MSAKTKIVVLKTKELIYTAIFLVLGILLILLFVNMFSGGNAKTTSALPAAEDSPYVPGVYRTSLPLGEASVEIAVTVDSDRISSVEFVSLPEETATMYPLLESSLDSLSGQIVSEQTLEVSYTTQTQYTSQALLSAIESAVELAKRAD